LCALRGRLEPAAAVVRWPPVDFSKTARGLTGRFMFGSAARIYDGMTDQPLWRAQVRRMLEHVGPLVRPQRVLDLGTGPGVSAFALAEALPAGSVVEGVDLSPEMIVLAKRHHRLRFPHLTGVRFHEGDAAALAFGDHHFDLVTGHSFLYLLPEPVAVLREVRRVLRPGAAAVFLEPSREGSLLRAARAAVQAPRAESARADDMARFVLSMVLWRVASSAHGQMYPARVHTLGGDAGFHDIATRSSLGGLGLQCVLTAPD
jgi:ubiquinone/menaquinone biosynthesis C-methylase UbiE